MVDDRPILFSAFEPSGDGLAAPVIAELRRRSPQQRIVALGGPKMKAAGAEMIEITTHNAVMLADSLKKVRQHAQRLKHLRDWLVKNPVRALVPVDSPAANWHVCHAVRSLAPDSCIIHLAAPQLWAWAPWRIRKLRRLTDQLLCVLPFEPDWFGRRGVNAVFVGHPLFDPPRCERDHYAPSADLPSGAPKLALLPGSRPGEIKANWSTMLRIAAMLQEDQAQLIAIAAASDQTAAEQLRNMTSAAPSWLRIEIGRIEDVLNWADVALAVSGTVTLQTLAHRVPMVTMYNVNRWGWRLVRPLIRTRMFTLPNLIGESMGLGRIAPEFVPHFGKPAPVYQAMRELIDQSVLREKQQSAFDRIRAVYEKTPFTQTAAAALMHAMEPAHKKRTVQMMDGP